MKTRRSFLWGSNGKLQGCVQVQKVAGVNLAWGKDRGRFYINAEVTLSVGATRK